MAISQPPTQFVCPITKKLMKEPMLSRYGHHFERSAILRWMEDGNNFCPVTGSPLVPSSIAPNKTLQWKIESWASENGYAQQPDDDDESPLPTTSGNGLSVEPPQRFHCPLSQLVMTDPVVTGEGVSFERAAILEWLEVSENCPVTGNPLLTSGVVANRRLKDEIEAWHARHSIQHGTTEGDRAVTARKHPKALDSTIARWRQSSSSSASSSRSAMPSFSKAEELSVASRDSNFSSLSSILRSLPPINGDSNKSKGVIPSSPSSPSSPPPPSDIVRRASLIMAAIDDALECSGAEVRGGGP